MSVATRCQSSIKPTSEPRAILGPGGNRVRVSEDSKRKKEGLKKVVQQQPEKEKPVSKIASPIVKNNASTDSLCSSDSCSSGSSVRKVVNSRRRVNQSGLRRAVKVVPDGVEVAVLSPAHPVPMKRCDWIMPNSDECQILFRSISVWCHAFSTTKLIPPPTTTATDCRRNRNERRIYTQIRDS